MPKIRMVRSRAALFSLAKSLRFICGSFLTNSTPHRLSLCYWTRLSAPLQRLRPAAVAIDEGIALEDFAGANGIGWENGPSNTKVWNSPFSPQGRLPRQIAEERVIQLAAGEASIENFGSMQAAMARNGSVKTAD